ncbi:NAD(P)-binding protein [Wolfiporia cocos MD-104 SS10]|uniref:NAD(P)-binding protein n=1 Tax=Wolfiporia cocos (strain MD-104) TaxID=742152 RepID=A0A2H3IXP9_WOLCO|nr:NAD(P)-binding protein [Wolfiporia cocos MD-104 SS10]
MPIPTTTREYRLPKVDGFHNLTLQEAPLRAPKSSEVLVKIHAVSLQYRDLIVAKGQYPLGQKENPVPGSDMAGEVIAVGDDVKGWKVGDRVCANFALDHIFGDVTDEIKATGLGAPVDGVLTEYRLFPAHSLVHIPSHLSYEEASTLPCAALTAYNALMGLRPLKGGDYVLVQGTGGVSIFGLQFAVASGATVIATSSSDKKLEIAKKLGAKHLINYKKTPDWEKEVLKITNGRGVDHVIEVGGSGTIMKSLASVRYAGIVSVIGFVAGGGDVSSLPVAVLGKSSIVRGILIGSRAQFEDMNRLIVAQNLKPVIDRVFSFEDVRAAYEYQESQQHVGKVVIRVSKD